MKTDFLALFEKELIFFEAAASSEEVLARVGQKLADRNLVQQKFAEELVKREKSYPTGLDLRVVDSKAPFNVAIPHTEREYCNCKRIVVVKLKSDVVFANMIAPGEQLPVKYLFILLNNEDGEQSNILADIMDFINKPEILAKLTTATTAEDIYRCIVAAV